MGQGPGKTFPTLALAEMLIATCGVGGWVAAGKLNALKSVVSAYCKKSQQSPSPFGFFTRTYSLEKLFNPSTCWPALFVVSRAWSSRGPLRQLVFWLTVTKTVARVGV